MAQAAPDVVPAASESTRGGLMLINVLQGGVTNDQPPDLTQLDGEFGTMFRRVLNILQQFGSGALNGIIYSLPNLWNSLMEDPLKTGAMVCAFVALGAFFPPGAMLLGAGMMAWSIYQTGGDPYKLGQLLGEQALFAGLGFGGAKLFGKLKGARGAKGKPVSGSDIHTVNPNLAKPQTIKLSSIDDQVSWLTKNVPDLNAEQARLLLAEAHSRKSSVVFGGSRIRGNWKQGSDLDVGFGGLSPAQARKVLKKAGAIEGGVPLEQTLIVPGNETKIIPKIDTPEGFFQRSGQRVVPDPRAGESFIPSGSVTVNPDGTIVIRPPGS